MKKGLLLLLILLLFTGCVEKQTSKNEPTKKEEETKEEIEEIPVDTYVDENNTPIGFYQQEGQSLKRLDRIYTKLVVEEDIGVFDIFPSNEETVNLNNGFAYDYYDTWMNYKQDRPLKMGFNIKFKRITGEIINYNILDPSHTFDQWEYLMNYLYDGYANRDKGFFSHIENDEYNENTLYTAFKMQSSYQSNEIASKILLTVFTYDSDDDFRDDAEYRGNSSATLTICVEGYECD
ncbi:MAG: hypothetical protein IJG68_04065 [Bacilli bacterium]|nr:hypothetical protein [Bacilli bacterium]